MPERKHNLPDGYDRLDDQITGDVADSIVIHPPQPRQAVPERPVEHGQPPARSPGQGHQHRADNQGVYTEQIQRGSAERYTVSYDVWNYPFRHRQPGPYA